MSSAWIAAGFGLLGTVSGGLITLGANWLSNQSEEARALEQRRVVLADRGYDAQIGFARCSHALADRAREYWVALDSSTDVAKAFERYVNAWREYLPQRAHSQLSVPAAIRREYERYHWSVIAFVRRVDDFEKALDRQVPPDDGELEAFDTELNALFEATEGSRTRYVEAARSHFSGD